MILLFKACGWWGPSHGGSHVKQMAHEDGESGGSGDYFYNDLLQFAHVSEFLSNYVYGKEKGSLIPNQIFIIGKLTSESVKEIGYFIDGFSDKHATVRISGRSLKHADEQRHESFIKIVDTLPDIIKNPEVIGNPNRDNSVFLVHQTDENYLLVLEIAKNGNGSDVVNIITTRDRGLKRHREKSSEWLEGRRSLILDTKRSHAGGDISDVQPSGSSNIPKPLKKSSDLSSNKEVFITKLVIKSVGEDKVLYDLDLSKKVERSIQEQPARKMRTTKSQTKLSFLSIDEMEKYINHDFGVMKKSILFIKSSDIQKAVPNAKKVILLFKSNVKGHTRRLRSGKLVYVNPYSNKIWAHAHAEDERQLNLFEDNKRQPDLFNDDTEANLRVLRAKQDVPKEKRDELVAQVADKEKTGEQVDASELTDSNEDLLMAKIKAVKRRLREAKDPEKINKIEREIRELRRQAIEGMSKTDDDKPVEQVVETSTDRSDDIDLAEDREDLADEMTRDPHSDKSRELLRKIAEKHNDTKTDIQPGRTTIADEDNPNSPNYRYRDTGYVAGSRKELAASVIRLAAKNGRRVNAQEVDWAAIETNPREAKELITKSNLFGDVSWGNLREQGMQSAAGFLIDRVYASVGTEPAEDSPQARKDYAFGLQTIRERLERCKSVDDVVKIVDEMRDESRGSMLSDEDADRYQALSAQAIDKLNERHILNDAKDVAYKVMRSARNDLYAAEYDINKRERRKWKVPPEMVVALEVAKVRSESAEKAWESVWGESKGKLDQLENDIGVFQREMHEIRERAITRNAAENPLTRAWNVLGARFNSVLNFRSSTFIYGNKRISGSEAFRSHVVSAKNDKIKDWAWAEKEGGTKVKQERKESVRFQLKVADKFDRVGGRKIKPESTVDLKDRFNLREVQSGNWVLRDPISAKFHVEHTAEAFADLADIIGVPDRDVSMNGRLAMAFGARGAGAKGWKDSAAMAHYEPVHRIINLTKMGGGGALGHEWAHALDNMIKEAVTGETGKKDDFASEDPTLLPSGELRDAFMAIRSAMLDGNEKAPEKLTYSDSDIRLADHNINRMSVGGIAKLIKEAGNAEKAVQAVDDYYGGRVLSKKSLKIKNDWRRIAVAYHDRKPGGADVWVKAGPGMSRFAIGARELDAGGTRYWESTHEMFARAFQSYIEDALASKGQKNDYLSVYADNKHHFDKMLGIQWRPYPEGIERERINIAMERLLAAVRKHDVLAKATAMFDKFMVG